MRIGVNCFGLNPELGGMRQYFFRLFAELLGPHTQHAFTFFCSAENRHELDALPQEQTPLSVHVVTDADAIRPHLRNLDLYFCPFATLRPRPVPIPSVMTIPDVQEYFHPEFFDTATLWVRARSRLPSSHLADAVITLSEFSRQALASHHHLPMAKVHAIHLGVDDSYFRPPEVAAPVPPAAKPFILYPANRWRHKNHEGLLRALRVLTGEWGVRVSCVLTGMDPEHSYPLQEKLAEYGLQDVVHCTAYLSPQEMRAMYARAALVCFPSLFEGFGMPVIEAMAAGCPVACSNTSCLPEIGGDAVLSFDPTDHYAIAGAVRTILTDSAVRDRLVAAGKARAPRFRFAHTAEKHLALFAAVRESYRMSSYYRKLLVTRPLCRARLAAERRRLASKGAGVEPEPSETRAKMPPHEPTGGGSSMTSDAGSPVGRRKMSVTEAIEHLRQQPEHAALIRDAYLDVDVRAACERFAASGEFQGVQALLGARLRDAVLLDLGAGNGLAAYAFARTGIRRVLAVEPDGSAVIGRGVMQAISAGQPIRILGAVGEALPVAEASVDIVYARQTLHHVRDLDAVARECYRVLRPGGLFLACREHVADDATQLQAFLADHPVHQLAGGEHAFPLAAYIGALERARFRVLQILGPWQSLINAFPITRTEAELARYPRKMLRRRMKPRPLGALIGAVPGVDRMVRARLDQDVPGRLYTFLAEKPA